MSGLAESQPAFVSAGAQVAPTDVDQYSTVVVGNPSTSATWFGTTIGTDSNTAITMLQTLADHPRNLYYTVSGVSAGTYGGIFTTKGVDQFGHPFTESVTIGTAVNGGTAFGTVIAAKVSSAAFATTASAGTFIGTANIGFGTLSNGSAQSNWFGLLTKIAGTSDVKMITWINNGTATGIAKGTNIGTSVSLANHAFQGTSGVAVTDSYRVVMKPTFDNSGKANLANL